MYDTIDLRLSVEEAGGVSLPGDILRLLKGWKKNEFENGYKSITGYLGSLKIIVSEKAVKVKDSSLCKWYLGDNFQGLCRGDARRAVERLSDELHLPMIRADVTRIDAAQNFIMQHEKGIYFDHMGSLNHYQRFQQSNGLYYSNGNKTLLFYEKVHEQTIKGQPVPELYLGRQVLRYEQRYKKRLLQSFNLPEIKASTLYNPGFYCDVVDRWRGEYEKIKKINDIQINYSMVKTKKQFSEVAILDYITRRGGELAVINEIREAYKRKELTKKQAHDLRRQVEEACKAAEQTCKSDVIKELDQKVKEAARFYL